MRQDIDHLTVLMEWMAEKGVTYNIRSESLREMCAKIVSVTTSDSSAQIMVSYNTFYNVSVEATLCGQMNVSTVEIYYGEFFCKQHGYFNTKIKKLFIQVHVTIHSRMDLIAPVL